MTTPFFNFPLPNDCSAVLRVSAAHLDRLTTCSSSSNRRTRRNNHLRKKLQVPPSLPLTTSSSSSVTSISIESSPIDDHKDSLSNDNSTNTPTHVLLNQLESTGDFSAFTLFSHSISISNPILNKTTKVGISTFLVLLAFKALFTNKQKEHHHHLSTLDKEMLTRKIKARMSKQNSKPINNVELIQDSQMLLFKQRPQLDKQQLINTITANLNLNLNLNPPSSNNHSLDFDGKIQEIRAMATHARQIDKPHANTINAKEVHPASLDVQQADAATLLTFNGLPSEDTVHPHVSTSHIPNNGQQAGEEKSSKLLDTVDNKPVGARVRIITSLKQAREYLDKKKHDQNEAQPKNFHQLPRMASSASTSKNSFKDTNLGDNGNVVINNNNSKDASKECGDAKAGELERANREKWMEDNFNEFEPIVDKIRGGFRKNYMVAKEKVKQDLDLVSELKMLQLDENESEFEWMKDDKLREIVFQVRENELMDRDPFYLMDAQDKALFFKGLEKKVEKENEKLSRLHEYLHSNIENLDYGADGISLYDPPEKIIPRWKGPPPATTMSQEFVDDYLDQRKALFAGNSDVVKRDPQNTNESKNLESSKTVIEGSDGSIKSGKKSGKEFWQHTKKWSRGFIDSYNAQNDPETKAVMKDIGKDLDRWITEKEIQDAADIMDKVPDKGKIFIAEKINKLKREMEMFGPQAVVSKYSEYGDEEEIDYYWWLDLPFLLCIELYINGDGDGRIGFYSLEMASELELDPKPHHIIAFEDAGDCKNLCYIIQAHMEMLGNGNAFVVPQAPKDTYHEAKGNGFNVTVIRKGEVKLDVDQTLEEVEEKLVEIGSKMYHDKIMKDRNVEIDSVMKGVFGLNKPSTNRRRRSKKKLKLKKPTK